MDEELLSKNCGTAHASSYDMGEEIEDICRKKHSLQFQARLTEEKQILDCNYQPLLDDDDFDFLGA